MTCRDRNRIALQGDMLGAAALGVHNILVLAGDDPKAGDQPDAKPVFDLNTRDLIATARRMRDEGRLPGTEIERAPELFIGAADVPTDPKPGWTPAALLARRKPGRTSCRRSSAWTSAWCGATPRGCARWGSSCRS